MKIILTALDNDLYDAWIKHCKKYEFVEIHLAGILDVKTDVVISPSNSFGFMDSGIDAVYKSHFGEQIEIMVQKTIQDEFDGELLVGQALLAHTQNAAIPYLIAAPTTRVPMQLAVDTINPYLAARAAILCALRANSVIKLYQGDPNARPIDRLSFPGLGMTSGVLPELCAYQVSMAIKDTLVETRMFPYSCQDAAVYQDLLLKSLMANTWLGKHSWSAHRVPGFGA